LIFNTIRAKYFLKSNFNLLPHECLIILYHRISNNPNYYNQLNVSTFNFENHIRYLSENFEIISLQDLLKSKESGNIPPKSIVITFDDGYADNFHNAKGILEKYSAPATFFVSTGNIDTKELFWWDLIELGLFTNKKSSVEVHLNLHQKNYLWKLSREPFDINSFINISDFLKTLNSSDLRSATDQLKKQFILDKSVFEYYRCLTSDEIKEIAKSALFEIGSHTSAHTSLAAETDNEQIFQIKNPKELLEKIIGKGVRSFSYPFGTLNDFSSNTIKHLRDQGYITALADIQGNVSLMDDNFKLPRRYICNWDEINFKNYIQTFFLVG